jgi:hypothetical protein
MSLKNRIIVFSAILALIWLTSCVAYTTTKGIRPIYPKESALDVSKVDSLKPEFIWAGENSKKYDIAIWNAVSIGRDKYEPFEIIYEKKSIIGKKHRISKALNPESQYYWSVRETGEEKWSVSTSRIISGIPGATGTIVERGLFSFTTPTLQEIAENRSQSAE